MLVLYLREGAQQVAALGAVKLDHLELGEHAGAAGHHTAHANKAVQVEVAAGWRVWGLGEEPKQTATPRSLLLWEV